MSQKIGRDPPNKRDPPRIVAKKGAFVPRYRQCLETIVIDSDIMTGGIRQMDMDEGIFGFPCTETVGQEDMEEIFLHKELGVGIMHSYIR